MNTPEIATFLPKIRNYISENYHEEFMNYFDLVNNVQGYDLQGASDTNYLSFWDLLPKQHQNIILGAFKAEEETENVIDDYHHFIEDLDGNRIYYDSGNKLHRRDAPAVELKNGDTEYWEHGEKYTAFLNKRGKPWKKVWRNEKGEYHRENFKPAIVIDFGIARCEFLALNGQCNSDSLHPSYTKFLNGKWTVQQWREGVATDDLYKYQLHNSNGMPAYIERNIVSGSLKIEYWIHGNQQRYSFNDFVRFSKKDMEKLSELERTILRGLLNKMNGRKLA